MPTLGARVRRCSSRTSPRLIEADAGLKIRALYASVRAQNYYHLIIFFPIDNY